MAATHRYVRVTRAFLASGRTYAVGEIVELPIAVTRDVVTANKAVYAEPPAPDTAPVELPHSATQSGTLKLPKKGV